VDRDSDESSCALHRGEISLSRKVLALCGLVVFGGIVAAAPALYSQPRPGLNPVQAFDQIRDPRLRSRALFNEAAKVFRHPRCTNCHAVSDRPRQGNRSRPHQPPVVRGAKGFGIPSLRCASCHLNRNYPAARIPGGPNWHMPPANMAFRGRTAAQICQSIKRVATTRKLPLDALVVHSRKDHLVIWAWRPGKHRQPPPGTHKRFVDLMAAWVATGGHCP
jgi:hypothetical protein